MQRMNKPFDLHTSLIIIYLALVAVSIALYALIQIFVDDKSTASNLLGWSATLFATIALLYTFNSWREQKGSDVLSKLSENSYYKINEIQDLIKKLNEMHIENARMFITENKLLYSEEEKHLNANLKQEIDNLADIIDLISYNRKDIELYNYVRELKKTYNKNNVIRTGLYETEDKISLSDHSIEYENSSLILYMELSNLSLKLVKYIFHVNDK